MKSLPFPVACNSVPLSRRSWM